MENEVLSCVVCGKQTDSEDRDTLSGQYCGAHLRILLGAKERRDKAPTRGDYLNPRDVAILGGDPSL